MELEPGHSLTVETVTIADHAAQEIAAAREAGVDPLEIASTHDSVARAIRYLISKEES